MSVWLYNAPHDQSLSKYLVEVLDYDPCGAVCEYFKDNYDLQ